MRRKSRPVPRFLTGMGWDEERAGGGGEGQWGRGRGRDSRGRGKMLFFTVIESPGSGEIRDATRREFQSVQMYQSHTSLPFPRVRVTRLPFLSLSRSLRERADTIPVRPLISFRFPRKAANTDTDHRSHEVLGLSHRRIRCNPTEMLRFASDLPSLLSDRKRDLSIRGRISHL